jgi:COMPASS component SWD3
LIINILTKVNLNNDDKGNLIISGSEDGNVIVWDLQNKEIMQKLIGHKETVLSIDCHPTLNILISTSLDKNIIIWKMNE